MILTSYLNTMMTPNADHYVYTQTQKQTSRIRLGLELGRPLPLPPLPVLIAPLQLRKRGIERLSPLDLLIPTLPHILTALPNLVSGILPPLLLPISRPYQLLLLLVPVTPRAHAEPEVAPVLRTRSHRPVAIEIVKLPA